jgi:hypothetical protein
MPVPLTEEETQNRQKALMEYLAKQAKEKNIDIPEANMGSFLGNIPGLDQKVQDAITAYQSGDTLDGGSGNDTLDGGSGNDTLDGGNGNDVIDEYGSTTTSVDMFGRTIGNKDRAQVNLSDTEQYTNDDGTFTRVYKDYDGNIIGTRTSESTNTGGTQNLEGEAETVTDTTVDTSQTDERLTDDNQTVVKTVFNAAGQSIGQTTEANPRYNIVVDSRVAQVNEDGSKVVEFLNEYGDVIRTDTIDGDGNTTDSTGTPATATFDPNDPRAFTASQVVDPLIPQRGILTYKDQEFKLGEEMLGQLGLRPLYDAEGNIVGYGPEQSAFLGDRNQLTAETAGKPIYDTEGNIIGYTDQGAQGADRQRPLYDTEGNIVGYTEGMQASTYDAKQLGLPIYNDQGLITGYTGQLKTTGATSTKDGVSKLSKTITAPTGPIDPATGLPTRPTPSDDAVISETEAEEIALDEEALTYDIDVTDLPSRSGMISDAPVIIRDPVTDEIIATIPAGAEIPTAATIAEFGTEAIGAVDRPQSDFVSDEDAAKRAQEDVTERERVAATQGGQILERALGKDTASLNPTELALAPAVDEVSGIVEELFPDAVEGNVQALDTVRGQLALLMSDFENDQTPDWAAGSIRVANQIMAERGLGNSTIAAATIVQAAQEAALPIAQADAQVYANMNLTNLSNQNKFALDNAAAARNFRLQDLSNVQQTELANSAQRYALLGESLSNYQSAMLANAQMQNALQEQDLGRSQQEQVVNAARYAELENMNLSHEQQIRVTNQANNLQVDLANLSTKEKATLAELQVQAALEGQELTNVQQTNVIKAQRYAEANNLDFTQEQNRVFSNSKMMETISIDNLEFDQARTLANAANYAQMDLTDLNNRQQAQVENARNFLQMDLANLSNTQQAAILDAQGLQQFMLSDQAAQNAALQFNATSQNQVDQFYEGLTADVNKFNANLMSTLDQFNAGQVNAVAQFNANLDNIREQFNATNALEIEQSNVNYRRELNTLNTAQQNAVNQTNAQNYFNVSQQALANIWQDYRDTLAMSFTQAQNDKDRAFNLAMAAMQREHETDIFDSTIDYNTGVALGNMAVAILATVSDVRLKTNIVKHKTFNNGLGWYSWEWTEEAKKKKGYLGKPEGFIAQEVSFVYPDTVIEKEDGTLAILLNDVLRRSENVE